MRYSAHCAADFLKSFLKASRSLSSMGLGVPASPRAPGPVAVPGLAPGDEVRLDWWLSLGQTRPCLLKQVVISSSLFTGDFHGGVIL